MGLEDAMMPSTAEYKLMDVWLGGTSQQDLDALVSLSPAVTKLLTELLR